MEKPYLTVFGNTLESPLNERSTESAEGSGLRDLIAETEKREEREYHIV